MSATTTTTTEVIEQVSNTGQTEYLVVGPRGSLMVSPSQKREGAWDVWSPSALMEGRKIGGTLERSLERAKWIVSE